MVLRVVKLWWKPANLRSSRATSMFSPRSITSALAHQAKRFGYASTSLTKSNICAGEYFTKALRRIWITAPSLQESRSSPRTGNLCGGDRPKFNGHGKSEGQRQKRKRRHDRPQQARPA